MCNNIKMNLHCTECGNGNIEKTKEYKIMKNEIGLSCKEPIYKCKDCNEQFIICPTCEGAGFYSKSIFKPDYNDCNTCQGMGLINIKNLFT